VTIASMKFGLSIATTVTWFVLLVGALVHVLEFSDVPRTYLGTSAQAVIGLVCCAFAFKSQTKRAFYWLLGPALLYLLVEFGHYRYNLNLFGDSRGLLAPITDRVSHAQFLLSKNIFVALAYIYEWLVMPVLQVLVIACAVAALLLPPSNP
jgi:hypothetical protein